MKKTKRAKAHKDRFFKLNNPPGRRSAYAAKNGTTLWDFLRSIEDQDFGFRVRMLQSMQPPAPGD